MNTQASLAIPDRSWLKHYYAGRALFSAAWVALAFTVGKAQPSVGLALLVLYPAWDALANAYDAQRSGGLRANPTQLINAAISTIVAVGVAIAAPRSVHAVIGLIGVWAVLAGLLQLATAVRRWRSAGAQWPMALSGAQSSLAGTLFVKMAADAATHPGVADVAPYAAVGAIYFAVSAGFLALSRRR